MSLINCGRCEQPFLSSTNVSICPSCLSRETHLFESYYYRIEKLIRERGLDPYLNHFPLDRERFKNAAHLRIGTGLVLHLEGWQRGFCYVCTSKQSHRESKEPICNDCFDVFFKSLASDQGLSVLVKKDGESPSMSVALAEGVPALKNKGISSADGNQDMESLKEELERYRAYYGELRTTECRVVTEEPRKKKVSLPPEVVELITEQVMEILSLSDDEISLENINWTELGLGGMDVDEMETIRLNGFKRLPNVF